MRGEGRGKMGAGVGGAPPPGSPQVTAAQQHEGSPGADPLTAWGDPHCRHLRWDGRPGRGFLCRFSRWRKESAASARGSPALLPALIFCPRWIRGTPPGSPDPESTAGHSSLPPPRALNSRFALSPGSTEAARGIAAATYSTSQWLNVTDASRGHGESSWTGSHGARLCPQRLQENPFPGL